MAILSRGLTPMDRLPPALGSRASNGREATRRSSVMLLLPRTSSGSNESPGGSWLHIADFWHAVQLSRSPMLRPASRVGRPLRVAAFRRDIQIEPNRTWLVRSQSSRLGRPNAGGERTVPLRPPLSNRDGIPVRQEVRNLFNGCSEDDIPSSRRVRSQTMRTNRLFPTWITRPVSSSRPSSTRSVTAPSTFTAP